MCCQLNFAQADQRLLVAKHPVAKLGDGGLGGAQAPIKMGGNMRQPEAGPSATIED